ncbi:MAG: hypothetical protein ACKVQK_26420 [Burkholderiales bacterium]
MGVVPRKLEDKASASKVRIEDRFMRVPIPSGRKVIVRALRISPFVGAYNFSILLKGQAMTISKAQRRYPIEQALANTRIEGHVPSPEFLADCEELVAGRLTEDDLRKCSLARALAKEADTGLAPVSAG